MNKKQLGLVIGVGVLAIITIIGTTFAVFSKTLFGTKKVSITTGTLKIDFNEGNAINLENEAPKTDTQGLGTTPYTFSIKNTGTIKAYYTISFEEDSANTLDNRYVKYKLTSDKGYDSGIQRVSYYGNGTFEITEEAELAVDEIVNYTLYLWLSEDADNSMQGTIYKSKIVVNSRSNPINGTLVAEKLLAGVGENGTINTTDSEQTFITGTSPNNYIWYSGKLWRAVSVDPADNSVKLVTQDNISAIPYNEEGNTDFEGSHMENWLNDESIDGFLGNLREPERFIKMDSKWNATLTNATVKPENTTIVEAAVGLLNIYEYTMSYSGTNAPKGYLNNGFYWWLLTPYNYTDSVYTVTDSGYLDNIGSAYSNGIRPVVNLKSSVKIVGGNGTATNPYRLSGDNDTPGNGTLLNTRYSGEYIYFGTGENNLYRIVSHENGSGTKIVSNGLLKESGTIKTSAFGDESTFSASNTIGDFLNMYPLTDYGFLKTYFTDNQLEMIEDSSIWYLGTVTSGVSYKLAKYTDTSMSSFAANTEAKVGLLRLGEQLAGNISYTSYWLLTPASSSSVNYIDGTEGANATTSTLPKGIRPAMNLKSDVYITAGNGTKENPFGISLQ